jgi:hypothetical protein
MIRSGLSALGNSPNASCQTRKAHKMDRGRRRGTDAWCECWYANSEDCGSAWKDSRRCPNSHDQASSTPERYGRRRDYGCRGVGAHSPSPPQLCTRGLPPVSECIRVEAVWQPPKKPSKTKAVMIFMVSERMTYRYGGINRASNNQCKSGHYQPSLSM